MNSIEQRYIRTADTLKTVKAERGKSPPSSSSQREKEKESGEAWPGPRSSAHANETLLHSEIAKIAPADRPPVRPVRGSIVCDVSGSLIASSYVREGEIQALYSTYTFRMIDSVITSVYGIPCNNPSYERYPTSGSYTTDVYNTAG